MDDGLGTGLYNIDYVDNSVRKVRETNDEFLRLTETNPTNFHSGRIKCHQYWPNVMETIDNETFTIRCRRERKENQLVYREFLFLNKETNEERIIYQIQTESWPDHGVPNDFTSFVEFVLEIRELRKSNKTLPILVHCRSEKENLCFSFDIRTNIELLIF